MEDRDEIAASLLAAPHQRVHIEPVEQRAEATHGPESGRPTILAR